ncbi:MAG: hypothetical protein EDM82_11335 [Cyanobacteria bacterium CYA]|nr:MAG: hypothetical protein EDM82_11335 [Cyanobacteria bacterium CYA]
MPYLRVLVCGVVTGTVLCLSPAASAQPERQQPAGLTIPKPKGDPKATPYTSMLTALLVSAAVVIVTLLPSKRGHQD